MFINIYEFRPFSLVFLVESWNGGFLWDPKISVCFLLPKEV